MPTFPRLLLSAALVVAVIAAFVACSGDDDDSVSGDGRMDVVATIAPVGAFVAEVGGALIDLRVIAGVGVDPHEYEIRADDRKAIDSARLVFRNGAGIDEFLDDAIDEDDEAVITLTDGLVLRAADEVEGHEQDDGHDHGAGDPHVWHDVDLGKTICDTIAEALAAADPLNADAYRTNATAYKAQLDDADAEVRELIESIPEANRKMVTSHVAFGYFIDRYGLTFVGAVIPGTSTAAEPSARDIADLVDTIEHEGVQAIFAESSVNPKIARTIADDTGVTVVDDLYGDSLGEPGSGAETVHGMLIVNATKIAEALR